MQPLAIVPMPDVPPRRRRILAIDDDDALLDMLVLLLRQEHLDFRAACGGQAGFDLAMVWDPDLILLDLSMPDLDGAAFVERYRMATRSQAAIVLLSGAIDGPAQATDLGVTMFLTKPFDLGVLVEVVDAYAWSRGTDTAFG